MRLPEHACALLVDRCGRLVLQLRPPWVRHAPSQLTCFGGKRDGDETAEACLRRELREELGWSPEQVPADGLDLCSGERYIARFIPIELPDGTALRPEPGSVIVRSDPRSLPGLPLSSWHRNAIAGWRQGLRRIDVP